MIVLFTKSVARLENEKLKRWVFANFISTNGTKKSVKKFTDSLKVREEDDAEGLLSDYQKRLQKDLN